MPTFINLEQGSENWLTWRQQGIGASEVATVMEESPWLSAFQLWSLKCGFTKPKPSTPAMEHGKNSEDAARQWYVANRGIEVTPAVAVYDDCEFIRASVDGWNAEQRHGVEIKCPTTIEGHRKAKEGEIPWFYMLQMLAEMETLDAASWDYCSWFAGDGVIIPVERNTELWLTEILPALQEFWRRVEEKTWPEPRGRETNESQEWALAAATVLDGKRRKREGEGMERSGKAILTRMATAKTTTGGGVKTVWKAYTERNSVVVTVRDAATAQKVIAALEPLRGKAGVNEIEIKNTPANLVLYVFEEGESDG